MLEKDNTTIEDSLEINGINKNMENEQDKSDLSINSSLSLEEIDEDPEENSTLNNTEGDLIENLYSTVAVG